MDKKDELQIKMVEVFPWNTNFETGISKIDEQHKRLVELLNMLAGHLAFRSDTIALNSIFVELTEYALYHFQYEEDVWEKYLGADTLNIAHKQEHSDFVNDILKLKAEEKDDLSEEKVAQIISNYDLKGYEKNGVGMVFVVDLLDKNAVNASMWVTFFSLSTKKVIFTEQLAG